MNTWHPQVRLKPNRIQSRVAFVILGSRGTEARTRQQCGRRSSLKHGESTDCTDPPGLHHTGPPHPFLQCPRHCISKSFVRNSSSTLSYQDVCSAPPHGLHAVPVPNLFQDFFSPPSSECCQLQGQRCPLKSHPEVTMSKWVTSVGHEKESEGERNSGGECVCSCSMVCRVQN